MEMYGRPITNNFDDDEASFRDQLASACHFNDADLAANKHGNLTPRQKLRLAFTALAPFLAMSISLVGLVAVAIGLYYFGPLIATRVRLMLYLSKYLVIGAAALFFGLIAFLIKFLITSGRIWNLLLDMSESRVTSVVGRLTTSKNEEIEDGIASFTKSKTQTFSYVVKGEYFQVPPDAWDAMRERDGGSYRVYVTPRSRYLVALESAISDPEAHHPFKLRSLQGSMI